MCQTKETMFSHKLVAIMDRFKKDRKYRRQRYLRCTPFFMNGFEYDAGVIEERTGKGMKVFLWSSPILLTKK